jgi:adenosylmethionine-8-amino-7-oxononanoate aminotransferase
MASAKSGHHAQGGLMKFWLPYTQMLSAQPQKKVLRARGAHIELANGQKILDGISSWWVITHGHSHPQIADAIAKQAAKLDQVVFANFSHESAEALADALAQVLPKELNRLFFSDNGSTAVEVAMKMAYQSCAQAGQKNRRKFLSMASAYHGDSCGAMSVSANSVFTKAYQDLRFEVIRCAQGRYSFDSYESWLADFRRKLARHGEELAAVIIEPLLQGSAGMIVWPSRAISEIGKLCQDFGILLIFDEVLTGFGRTGTMFAFEQSSVMPDILCLSKGLSGGSLPLAITLTNDKIYERFLSKKAENMLFHGHSFTANAISCAAALANLKVFQSQSSLSRIAAIESVHRDSLRGIARKIPLKDSRILGSVAAIELDTAQDYAGTFSQNIAHYCFERGLFLRPLGNVIYLMPPYCVDLNELRHAWDIIGQAVVQEQA